MINATEKKLDMLIQVVQKLLDNPVPTVTPISPIAPVAPVAPLLSTAVLHSGDHDVITALVVSVGNLEKKVDAIALQLDSKYTTIDEHKVVVGIQTDHETRIRNNEVSITKIMSYGSALIVFVGILEFLISKILIH